MPPNYLLSSAPDDNPDYDQLLTDLLVCHKTAAKGKRDTVNNILFETNALPNIVNLATSIYRHDYIPSRSIAFIIQDPVIREIFAAHFRDRIVHHYIYSKTIDWWTARFVKSSYSCIKGRGTLKAIQTTYEQMREISNNFTEETYFFKMDLQGYFMSLNRKKLLKTALAGLDEQFRGDRGFIYHTLAFLWTQTIMDDPVKSCSLRNYPRDWEKLPKSKSLLNQPPGVGIVIGNLTSQELSNIYLNDFDHFVTETLGFPYYGRYVDDFVFFVRAQDMPKAKEAVKRIETFLVAKGLTLHPKKRQVQEIHHGLPFLGVRLFPDRIQPGRRMVQNAFRAAKKYRLGAKSGEGIISYLGILQNYDSEYVSDRLLDIIIPDDPRFVEPPILEA